MPRKYAGPLQPGKRSAYVKGLRANKKKAVSTAKQTKQNTKAIARINKDLYAYRQYQLTSSGVIQSNLHVERIIDPQAWGKIFQSTGDTEPVREFMLNQIKVKYAFQCENDATGNLWFQMWIVKLRPKYARQLREDTGDIFNLVNGEHYIRTVAGTHSGVLEGFCNFMLNPAVFKVCCTTGQQRLGQTIMGGDNTVTNIRDSTHQGMRYITHKRKIKSSEHLTNGFLDLPEEQINDNTAMYTIILSNAGVTSGLFRSINYQFNGRTRAHN